MLISPLDHRGETFRADRDGQHSSSKSVIARSSDDEIGLQGELPQPNNHPPAVPLPRCTALRHPQRLLKLGVGTELEHAPCINAPYSPRPLSARRRSIQMKSSVKRGAFVK